MRNKRFLIGVVTGLAGALALSGVAQAAPPSSQSLETTLRPAKQDKKKFGGVSLHNVISTFYPNFINSPSPQQTVFTIDKNVRFVNGNLPACPLASIQGRPTAVARGQCANSITGDGTVEANNGAITGVVTFFTGGPKTIFVHTDLGGGALIIPITGTISKRLLTFTGIPNTPGTSLTKFDTTFRKIRTSNKKKGKFYVMARCPGKKKKAQRWSTRETTTFYTGQQLTASSSQKCKQKKSKKK
jgi:hypothetical protein